MKRTFDWLGGFLLGAAVMSLADPVSGPRRRAFLRGKTIRTLHGTTNFLDRAVRDLRNRASGAIAEARARHRNDEAEDPVLVERVRSKLGRRTISLHAIDVDANRGRVTLRGSIPAAEAEAALAATAAVHGVTSVLDRLEWLDSGEAPSTSNGTQQSDHRSFASWSPGMQLLAGAGGMLVLATGAMLLARSRRVPAKTLPDYASLLA